MTRIWLLLLLLPLQSIAQKKPLDHSVYDGWQSLGERMISNDGKWVVYTVTPQEGDAQLVIQSTKASTSKKEIPRGYNAVITEDSKFAVLRIRPPYKDSREARIKKRKPEDMPKDSFAIVELGRGEIFKVARIKGYKTPEKGIGWVAYHRERDPAAARTAPSATQKTVDSLQKKLDSLLLLVREIKNVKAGVGDAAYADEDPAAGAANEGSDLVLRNLAAGRERVFKNVVDYYFDKGGKRLMLRVAKSAADKTAQAGVLLYDLQRERLDTILKGGNDFKGFAFSEDGAKAAFLAERDTAKGVQRFYSLYVYRGEDSATLLVNKATPGMTLGHTVSEWGNISFSKSGNRLFFGTAPVAALKDTSLVDIDLVKVDVWHYNDDYLQTQQLFGLQNELRRNYLAVFDFSQNRLQQLGSKALPTIIPMGEGDAMSFIATTDTGRRVQRQWGDTKTDVYAVAVGTGKLSLVKKNHEGGVYPSSTGKYILLFDSKRKHYFAWDGKTLKNVTSRITVPLWDEEHDTPAEAPPYGVMGWHQGDSAVYVYDQYDVWKVGLTTPGLENITKSGRAKKEAHRYVRLDPEEKFFVTAQPLYFRVQQQLTKRGGVRSMYLSPKSGSRDVIALDNAVYSSFLKAKAANLFLYSRETYTQSPNLFIKDNGVASSSDTKLSALNPQQAAYNWGTAELYRWKTFSGKMSDGILYKPEDFNPKKKYPMIIYFYERLSDGLFGYQAPSPTPSRLNIPFYVSRGYIVFAPDISYTRGGTGPGKDAYDYIVSGAQALAKLPWVDARNIAVQGQSWGGYQVAHLITRTNMFKAAWAGAPVVNMFSAYGGIRWESGVTRQSQYEKGQSRIGYNIWEKRDLYIENSPLFHLPKVNTPVVIMSNDADGAVPWQQGIEMFTALRRLNKKVWMLNYNGEAHNLVERKNRKDIQLRQQQFFDYLLKGEKPAEWITEGVPAVKKGRDWGLEIVD
ncbi:MAG TPA: prolyl oligopeptidase family serine peptidase [Flavisolibacter sp.]